ncbi:MAG: surfactin/lichenysin synthetase, partial [Acidobacteriota bacterium]|nr:surfactin/lichenysin synthetase [Acidobacteriota bacterium]
DQKINDQNENRHFGAAFVLYFEHLNFEFVSNFDIRASNFKSSNLAYVIYTSGTTGRPKGVAVEHSSVVNILTAMQREYPLKAADTFLLKTSYMFDVSVSELFGWFLEGGKLAILERGGEKDPAVISAAIERYCITHINFVPSMFSVFVDDLEAHPQNIIKLSGLKYIFLAGEALIPKLIKRFKQFNTEISLENIYGPTEGTVYSTLYSLKGGVYTDNIPIGKPMQNVRVFILDKNGNIQPGRVPGELYIGGVGVARGYLNRPELTAEKFNRSYKTNRTYILYRTGDLARWLPCGNIEFLGRIDHQVKVRGFRIELGEIERRLLSHPRVREVVVVARESEEGEDKYLCAYIIPAALHPTEAPETAELRDYLAVGLPAYMVPAYFVMLEKMPLNPNGKLDRKALPEPDRNRSAARDYVPPQNEMQHILVGMFSEVLGIERNRIGIYDNFFRLGGHSLKSTGLALRIHKRFDIQIPLGEIFKAPTVNDLARYIETAKKSKQLPIEPVEKKEYYELSPAQERFFIFQRMEPGSVSYNIPEVLRLDGRAFKEKFETALKGMIHRHESLRTSFELVDGKPVQRVHAWEEAAFEVEYDEFALSGQQLASSVIPQEFKTIEKNFIRPFDLSRFPLLRLRLVKVAAEVYFLLFDIHHIVSDGVSTGIFIEEFLTLYNGEKLPALTIQYKDYVNWINEKRKIDRIAASSNTGGIQGNRQVESREHQVEVLHLPTDYPRSVDPNYDGKLIPFEIEEREKEALLAFSLQQDTTLYMILLSAFNIFLSKLCDQDNIVVGSPMAGRQHQDLAQLIGLFINTLVIRNFPTGEKRFPEFLAEVKENTLQAFDSQQYQYEQLVNETRSAANTGRNPLFDVMFVLQNMKMPPIVFPGIRVTRYRDLGWSSKFDMTLYCEEYNNYLFKLEYSTSLFKAETIQRFIVYFKKSIASIAANPELKIAEIDILPVEEKQHLIYDLNNSVVDFPQDKTIFQVFQEQVGRTPGHIAVTSMTQVEGNMEKMVITYRQLQEKVNRLARLLRKRGIKPNMATGIMMERSLEALVAILGILTAGGAYVPIDPDYPDNRIIAMLENSGAAFLLTGSGIVRQRPLHSLSRQQEMLALDKTELAEEMQRESAATLAPASAPGDLIYIIFTSGSTGMPKGAGVYHSGFMNLMHWFVSDFNLGEKDSNLWLTSLSFDLTQKNLYASIITGGTLCIPHFNYFEPRSLLGEIHHNRVTWINCTPSMFYKLVEYESSVEQKQLTSLRYVFLGGEPIYMSVLIDWLESEECRAEIINTYGPTECTDISNS